MKRITSIEIDNYKAYIKEERITCSNGENLLIYGENGSGKSSLYNAIRHFMETSVNSSRSFDTNYYSGRTDGKIKISFQNYDPVSRSVFGLPVTYEACNDILLNSNAVDFIKLGYRVSGFMDYSKLLKVYLNRGTRPNLFELVMELLRDYVPTKQGLTESITQLYDEVNAHIGSCYHRSDREYQRLKANYNKLAASFPSIVSDLNSIFSRLMSTYFPMFNLNISLVNPVTNLNENGYVRDTRITGEIYLDVEHYGQPMPQYNNSLNEARLSAIAICLYLSTLRLLTISSEVKVLFLDDIFVGLDSSNRRPVLRLLITEFSDYQMIISTYDKSWYLLACEYITDKDGWRFLEIYEGKCEIGSITVPKPVIVNGTSEIDKARKYLYDNEHPDYSAAANYMRKAYEGLLSNKLYRPAILDNDLVPVASFRIEPMLAKYEFFINAIRADKYAADIQLCLIRLRSFLRPMLHPLSHYSPDNPIHKGELIEAEHLYDELDALLEKSDYKKRCKVVVPAGGHLMFRISGTRWSMEYLLEMEQHLISYENALGVRRLTESPMHVLEFSEIIPHKAKQTMFVNSKMNIFQSMSYTGLQDCAKSIYNHLSSPSGLNKQGTKLLANIEDMFFCVDIKSAPPHWIEYSKVLSKEL